MGTNVSVGFSQRNNAGPPGGNAFTSFATGAANKATEIYDEERQQGHKKTIALYKSNLDAGNIKTKLSQQEQMEIRKEKRAAGVVSQARQRKVGALAGMFSSDAAAAGQSYGITITEKEIQDMAKNMADNGVTGANYASSRQGYLDAVIRSKIIAGYKNTDTSKLDPATKQMLIAMQRGEDPSKYQKHLNDLELKVAGNPANPQKTIDPKYNAIADGAFPNAIALKEDMDTQWSELGALSGTGSKMYKGNQVTFQQWYETGYKTSLTTRYGVGGQKLYNLARGDAAGKQDEINIDAKSQADMGALYNSIKDSPKELADLAVNQSALMKAILSDLKAKGAKGDTQARNDFISLKKAAQDAHRAHSTQVTKR
tara:strand:- start:617 stop:1726 length:1110 start_codon:yes stop_codon:yes gene_type:complete